MHETAAVKLVTKASQGREIGTRGRRRKYRGLLNLRIASIAGVSERQTFRKKTTLQVLERLESEIKSIEEYGQVTEQKHKRIIGYVMAYSVGIYVLMAILYYCMFVGKSQHWLQAIQHASPLLVLPVVSCPRIGCRFLFGQYGQHCIKPRSTMLWSTCLQHKHGLACLVKYHTLTQCRREKTPLLHLIQVVLLRSGISWWYNWSLRKNRIKLAKLRTEKKKILEDVMNTETYKVAKEILDKFGGPDEQVKTVKPFIPSTNVPGNAPSTPPGLKLDETLLAISFEWNDAKMEPVSMTRVESVQEWNQDQSWERDCDKDRSQQSTPGQLRQRQLALLKAPSTPATNNLSLVAINNSTPKYIGPRLRSNQLPRPLLDSNRSALDRVVDYLLKDGPNHRMALICAECHSHNGMAMIEEFDYVSYACAYCGKFNPARKRRPAAPPLALSSPVSSPRAITDGGDDSSIASSGSETEEEKKSVNNSCSESERDQVETPASDPEKSAEEKKED
ncbi:Endoplasmic reticulum junction formation protein lunapark [Eumeta japonica]|uniref:Endoplasmic reticulum junction formation protein lunapark n=1 Tax=Eumeta variegata TaxID=151549 RepID=A0A4C1W3Q8_EUMVA|nr:Endoplasmic reticulum junction formation protein lunapark [Eumeta japonica]